MVEKINGKIVLGLIQEVKIFDNSTDKSRSCLARVDTGATKSSIDAALVNELHIGPVLASKYVKSAHGRKMRPIVLVEIEIKGTRLKEEFTVADRTHMKYPLLIGQNILKDFIIDPSK
ncbi:ATP-dependent zinc protease [Candidatus Woesearchaeota archaeon]|nr:ATP-dependent zinc protease [Candidatus Woesearchaeota archaeon]